MTQSQQIPQRDGAGDGRTPEAELRQIARYRLIEIQGTVLVENRRGQSEE